MEALGSSTQYLLLVFSPGLHALGFQYGQAAPGCEPECEQDFSCDAFRVNVGMPLQQVGRSFWDYYVIPRLSGVFLLHTFVLSDPRSGFVPWASQNKQCKPVH